MKSNFGQLEPFSTHKIKSWSIGTFFGIFWEMAPYLIKLYSNGTFFEKNIFFPIFFNRIFFDWGHIFLSLLDIFKNLSKFSFFSLTIFSKSVCLIFLYMEHRLKWKNKAIFQIRAIFRAYVVNLFQSFNCFKSFAFMYFT